MGPLYAAAEPCYLGRPYAGPWQVVARADASGTAAQALADLESGAAVLELVFAGAPSAFGRGLSVGTVADLDAALAGVVLDLVPIRLAAGSSGLAAAALFAALAERRGSRPASLHAGIDPVGAFAFTGAAPPWLDPVALVDAVAGIEAIGAPGTALLADGRIAAEAGAAPATEIAFALHAMATMMRLADAGGLGADKALAATAMALSASENQFATIAKFRAARRLHALMAEAVGLTAPLMLHGETLHRMLAFNDPQTNLLRLTIAAFSAGVGGADSVSVLPFDAAATPFARRMARNIQTLLIEESHVGRLSDPGAGAGAVEAFTDELAEIAWSRFQLLESEGDAVATGKLAEMVATDRATQLERLKDKERAMIGVTIHPPQTPAAVPPEPSAAPLPAGAPVARDFAGLQAAAAGGTPFADIAAAPAGDAATCPPLTPVRVAASFGG
ncbi:methylmalonyl-CoA mutase family protein [Acuticoccus sp. I52.16.1]|uniref:methylmalonyl-CoA mutase family protein n=1 Tax=Acuticoccus sp. I52.16.1 TaxID=2928472 RepID=UPI001FCFC582|nr:methylmalonyl-CoA mutase family protein [Acuticoccus sp. I52.16.1]UOM35498.1 methylmalonyl-CoA mutase family protein [Acuticoccus sp. I52.16.1]